jgi:hypothetical protein
MHHELSGSTIGTPIHLVDGYSLHLILIYILQYNLTCTSETCPPHLFAQSIITLHNPNLKLDLNSVSPLHPPLHLRPHRPTGSSILYLYRPLGLTVPHQPLPPIPSPHHLLSAGNHSTSPPPPFFQIINLVHVPKPHHHPSQK